MFFSRVDPEGVWAVQGLLCERISGPGGLRAGGGGQQLQISLQASPTTPLPGASRASRPPTGLPGDSRTSSGPAPPTRQLETFQPLGSQELRRCLSRTSTRRLLGLLQTSLACQNLQRTKMKRCCCGPRRT